MMIIEMLHAFDRLEMPTTLQESIWQSEDAHLRSIWRLLFCLTSSRKWLCYEHVRPMHVINEAAICSSCIRGQQRVFF